MSLLLVSVGGAVGALLRYYMERWSVHRFGERIPWGTALANLLGATFIGLLAGWLMTHPASRDLYLFLGTGLCGALTTFGGFMGQVENRWRHADTRSLAVSYVVLVTGVGLALVVAAKQGRNK